MSFEKFLKKTKHVEQFWGDRMPMMAMEECGELIQAISKIERKGRKPQQMANLYEEIRDMYISLAAIQHHYGVRFDTIGEMIDDKLNTKKEK